MAYWLFFSAVKQVLANPPRDTWKVRKDKQRRAHTWAQIGTWNTHACMDTHHRRQTATILSPHFWSNPLLLAAPQPLPVIVELIVCCNFFVINYVFGRGVSLQEKEASLQQSRNSVFLLSCSILQAPVHMWANGTRVFFLFFVCFLAYCSAEGNMKDRVTMSLLKASGYLNNLCASGLPARIFPAPKCYAAHSTHSALLS